MAKTIQTTAYRLLVTGIIVFSSIGCDQASKYFARDILSGSQKITTLSGILNFEHAQNKGAFLSLGSNLSENTRKLIFIVMVAVFLSVLAFFLIKSTQSNLSLVGYSLFIGGGVGNLIDRIWMGSVTDFILLRLGPLQTGIFNFADMIIILGFLLLTIDSFLPRTQKMKSSTG